MIAHKTDPLPAPVAPTQRTWWPTSRSRYTVPSSHSATGIPAVSASASASNGGTVASSGSSTRNHSSTSCFRFRIERTRQSNAPNVVASRSATAA